GGRGQNLRGYLGDADARRGCEACECCKGSRAPEPEEIAALARKPRATEPGEPEDRPYDAQVFEKLRALRTELARETRVPPYVVFHDATLKELARALPQDEKSFLRVKGAGPNRWQRYGERVGAITRGASLRESAPVAREPEAQRDLGLAPPDAAVHEPEASYGIPSGLPPAGAELWTLCASGATLGDICSRLRRTAADVASELADGARMGKVVD